MTNQQAENATLIAIKELEKVLRELENGSIDVETFMWRYPVVETTPPEAAQQSWEFTGERTYHLTVKPTNAPRFDLRPTV